MVGCPLSVSGLNQKDISLCTSATEMFQDYIFNSKLNKSGQEAESFSNRLPWSRLPSSLSFVDRTAPATSVCQGGALRESLLFQLLQNVFRMKERRGRDDSII